MSNVTSPNISVIPAVKRKFNNQPLQQEEKLRVAAYCRVSTDTDEQLTSYEAQISHYSQFISSNPQWTLAGIYSDEGISATNTKKRTEFQRMIDDCMAGKIDYVVTKSVSRFARNTVDCLKYVRQLKDKGISVFFEKENILSTDSKGDLFLTIMSSIAEQESLSLSQNVKLGNQYRYQKGQVQINHNRFLGYTKDENKQLVIVPEEAAVVKRIFREYLEGSSLLDICKGLMADGILTGAGNEKWRPETVKKILCNEKFIGDARLQKTYTIDFLNKKRVVNNGIVPQYYVENSHEAIIPRELFLQVQDELVRRACLYDSKGSKHVYSSKYALSSIVYCGECGEIYRRVHWNNRAKKSIVWRCISRLEEKGSDCESVTVSETTLQSAIVQAINSVIVGKEDLISTMLTNMQTAMGVDSDMDTAELDKELLDLQNEILRLANDGIEYSRVANRIYELRDEKQRRIEYNSQRQGKRQRIEEMTEYLQDQSCLIFEYSDSLTRRLVEKVTVFEKTLTIAFKSGIDVEIKI